MIITLRENKTLREMLIGIALSCALIAAITAIVAGQNRLYYLIGLATGALGASFMAWHMAYSIEDAVMLNENDAAAYTRKMTLIRYFVACAVLVLVGVLDFGSPVMCVVGVLLLKAGAYLQPLVHKMFGGDDSSVDRTASEDEDNNNS